MQKLLQTPCQPSPNDVLVQDMYNPQAGTWARAISFESQGEGVVAANVTVANNLGLRLDSFFYSQGVGIVGLQLVQNTVAQCGGNCVFLRGAADMHVHGNVFLRDSPQHLFLHGTTDIIIGTVHGTNRIEGNAFSNRGEFAGAADGCAIDFETSATGFAIVGNTFAHSYGSGIMVFGHETTSHNLTLDNNVFVENGCLQPRNDRGAVAFICPHGNKPDGTLRNNVFATCPNGVPAIYDAIPNCSSEFVKSNNTISSTAPIVAMPYLQMFSPPMTSNASSVLIPIIASTITPNATIRYSLDGGQVVESSPVLPLDMSFALRWPSYNVAINVRAFKEGLSPSPTNGAVLERRNFAP